MGSAGSFAILYYIKTSPYFERYNADAAVTPSELITFCVVGETGLADELMFWKWLRWTLDGPIARSSEYLNGDTIQCAKLSKYNKMYRIYYKTLYTLKK